MLIHANFGAFFGALALSALPETQKNLKSTVKTRIKSHSFRSIFCHSFCLLVTFLLCCECPYCIAVKKKITIYLRYITTQGQPILSFPPITPFIFNSPPLPLPSPLTP